MNRVESLLTWLGGGQRSELAERHERSSHAVAGAVVALGAALAWLVASLAVSESARLPMLAIAPMTLTFGLLVGAVTRGAASGSGRGLGRTAVAVAVGLVVGELAAIVLFASTIDRRLDQQALRNADSAPAVAQASAALQQARDNRAELEHVVAQARQHQDGALVIARCEYNPSPACPQSRITGVPGPGPETRTSNELLADAQRELDNALAARDRQAPELDATVSEQERALAAARGAVVAVGGRGLGARWVAMNELTLTDVGALMLRLLTIAVFALIYLLPSALRRWRGETTQDRRAAARADRERAEISRERAETDADTAIAIKRAQVRREAEIMWAEHQLTQARLAIEAQEKIDREQQRRRVITTLDLPMIARRTVEPMVEDIYLPIAAEAEAASRAAAALPTVPATKLPAVVNEAGSVEPQVEPRAREQPSTPARTMFPAARWLRPLVPPFVAKVIDDAVHPVRSARQVFEDVEEIAFSFKRTRRVTRGSETTEPEPPPPAEAEHGDTSRIAPSRSRERTPTPSLTAGSQRGALAGRDVPRELDPPDGPRQLSPPR